MKSQFLSVEETNRIGISMDIDEVMEISDKDYSITIAMHFNVEWQEPRLKLLPSFGASKDLVSISVDLIQDLWQPDPFIYNLKSFKVIDTVRIVDRHGQKG